LAGLWLALPTPVTGQTVSREQVSNDFTNAISFRKSADLSFTNEQKKELSRSGDLSLYKDAKEECDDPRIEIEYGHIHGGECAFLADKFWSLLDFKLAIGYALKACERDPSYEHCTGAATYLLRTRRPEVAIEILKQCGHPQCLHFLFDLYIHDYHEAWYLTPDHNDVLSAVDQADLSSRIPLDASIAAEFERRACEELDAYHPEDPKYTMTYCTRAADLESL
jgi:hypothetical protein